MVLLMTGASRAASLVDVPSLSTSPVSHVYQYLDMFDSESDISGDNSEDELVEVL